MTIVYRCAAGRPGRLPKFSPELVQRHKIIVSNGRIDWAQQAATAFAEAAARRFEGSAFDSVPVSPDLERPRACIDFLVKRDA